MYYNNKKFFLFVLISVICIGLSLFIKDFSKDLTFMVLAMDDNPIFVTSLPINTNLQNQQKSEEIADKPSKAAQHLEERDTCPPKPQALEIDPLTSQTREPNADPDPPIRIKVPTLANTGSSLLIEGTGFTPLEQVRVELSVDWTSSSHELKDKTFYQCKIVEADNLGSFLTTLQLPEMPFYTKGSGKYNIIGMESRQEKTALGSFSTSKIGFSFRQ